MQRKLEYQADQIEMVLRSHKVPARVSGGVVTPRWIRFEVLPALGAKVSSVTRLSEEIALRLGSRGVRVQRQGSRVHIEVPREDSQAVRLLPLAARLKEVPRQTTILGLDEGGVPILLRLPSPNVGHVLIAGTTGSGKTALVRTMALSLALYNRQADVQLVVIDPKGRSYQSLSGLPHLLRPIAREPEEALAVLEHVVKAMQQRDREGVQEPRLVVIIDEMADLVMSGGQPVLAAITRLTQRGREAGIHVIGCTQKPTTAAIGSLVKSNFPVRLVGSVTSPEDARVATGLKGTGAEKLGGQGDFLLVVKGEIIRFQAAYVTQDEIQRAVDCLQQGRRNTRQIPAQLTEAAPTRQRRSGNGKMRGRSSNP